MFVGFNHFRETVVFGAALMYDETFESFKWLFETKAHNGQQPKTFYTDQDVAMGEVVAEAWHGLCTFHIMQNAKHLHEEKDEEKEKVKKKQKKKIEKKMEKNGEKNESLSILLDFSDCMFEYEDMVQFEQKFNLVRQKVSTQIWLDSIYKLK